MIFHLITFGNPPIPSARSSFKEPVDITGPRLEPKNRFKDNIDSLPKSLASCESARRRALSFCIILASSCGSSSNSGTSAESTNGVTAQSQIITNPRLIKIGYSYVTLCCF